MSNTLQAHCTSEFDTLLYYSKKLNLYYELLTTDYLEPSLKELLLIIAKQDGNKITTISIAKSMEIPTFVLSKQLYSLKTKGWINYFNGKVEIKRISVKCWLWAKYNENKLRLEFEAHPELLQEMWAETKRIKH